jgi:hypothetical protein
VVAAAAVEEGNILQENQDKQIMAAAAVAAAEVMVVVQETKERVVLPIGMVVPAMEEETVTPETQIIVMEIPAMQVVMDRVLDLEIQELQVTRDH